MTRIATITGPRGHVATFSSNATGPWPQLDLIDIAGWSGGVGTKDRSSPRLGHGMFAEPTRYTGRGLTVYAYTKYETLEQRAILERGFSSMLAEPGTYRLTVEIEGHSLFCDVKQDGEIGVTPENFDGLNIQIPLEAPDPYLYAEEKKYTLLPAGYGEGLVYPLFQEDFLDYGDVSPGTGIPIRNAGTAVAYPRFEVYGNWSSGFRITSGRDSVEYGSPVLGPHPVVIDMATGSVTVDGNDRSHLATRRSWFGVGPSSSIQPRISAVGQGTGWADVYLSDTYL